jgi:Ankyrin repeats (3 copies)
VRAAAQLTSKEDAMLEALLQAAPVNALAEATQHALMRMCGAHRGRHDSTDCAAVQRRASLLLSRGACVNKQEPLLQTLLYSLAASGCAGCTEHFIEQLGADATAVFADNSTALHVAACACHSNVVLLLLRAGCDVHAQTTAGYTALHAAVAADVAKSVTTIKALLDAKPTATTASTATGDDISDSNSAQQQQQQQPLLTQQDVNGCTALHLAVGTDRLSGYMGAALTTLLKHSSAKDLAAALTVTDKHGSTVLHYAVAKPWGTEMLDLLLEECKRVGALQQLLSLPDAAGLTPVRIAFNDAAVIEVLQRYTNKVRCTHAVTLLCRVFNVAQLSVASRCAVALHA